MSRSIMLAAVLTSSCLAAMSPGTAWSAAADGVTGANVGAAQSAQVQVKVHGQVLGSAEFAELRGEYRLADGRRLSIEGVRSRPTVALGDRDAVRLVALGENRFVSVDGAIRLRFNAHANGSIDAVTITLPNGTH